MKQLLSLLLLLSIFSQLQAQDYRSNVALLNDKHDRSEFLISVYNLNQEVRSYEDSVVSAGGFQSEAHQLALDSLLEVDSILSKQIDEYLQLYGFPSREDYSEIVRITPWLILHHSRFREIKDKNFDKLYTAYEDGDLEQRRLIGYLEREYRSRFQREYQSYAVEDQLLEELMKELELKKGSAKKNLFNRLR